MIWNIAPECTSLCILCIIWIYSRNGNPLRTLKNRIFQYCFFFTFLAMSSNILSTLLIYQINQFPLWVNWLVTSIYFASTPLMGAIYYLYVSAIAFEGRPRRLRLACYGFFPALFYLLLVFINPLTGQLFTLSTTEGYRQGPLISLTYLIFYFYGLICLLLVLCCGKRIKPPVRRILISFPLIAATVIVIQQFYPSVILSGSAATCALLLIYLYLQNKQISIDHLTGIFNRQALSKLLELRLKEATIPPFSVLVLSLSEFKQVNNAFGQQNGDLFLQNLCAYLKSISPPDCLYRYSGDEFAILLEQQHRERSQELIMQIQQRMAFLWQVGDYSCLLTFAIAVVKIPDTAGTLEEIVSGIESAVAIAKSDKTVRVCFCDSQIIVKTKRRQEIIRLLRKKLEENSFEVYFQPIYSLKTKRFMLAEALLRMNGTPLGNIYPSEFIPIAEETTLIIDIFYQVLEKVCAFIARMSAHGIELDGISVNFSGVQLMQPDLAARVLQIIESSGVPFSKIKAEITESTIAENLDAVLKFIDTMQQNQIRIALDDFGTGFSNIASVSDMPLNTIKLDKSLIWSAMSSRKSAILVESLALIFRKMEMEVLAEGIETQEQLDFATGCGCSYIQGFFFAKPMPEAEYEQFLIAQDSSG